jgi:tRNA (guanine37-N1)-methyltransferase
MSTPEEGRDTEKEGAPLLRFDVFTLFPGMFRGPLDESIMKRGQERGLIEIAIHDLRDWTTDRHRTADDTPYGGGAGMVMRAPPVVEAVESVLGDNLGTAPVLIMAASGRLYNQETARRLAQSRRVAIICGHYEGIDYRATLLLNAEEYSIGDYVLTGGEIPALVVLDSVARLVPGVILEASTGEESFQDGLIEYPQYTRPAVYRGLEVPGVLLSGHHAQIAQWRREQSIRRTAERRPDLLRRALASGTLSEEEAALANELLRDHRPDSEQKGGY